MAVFGNLGTLRAQLATSPGFARALDYMERCLTPGSAEAARIAAIPEGVTERVELGGGVFALEQVYRSKPPAEGRWEAHEVHADVQVVLEGEERMDVVDVARLSLEKDLRATRDLLFFARPATDSGVSALRVAAGEAAVFFPADAHMPSLAIDAPRLMRKTVVKVPVAVASAAKSA